MLSCSFSLRPGALRLGCAFALTMAALHAGCATTPPTRVAERADALMRDLHSRNLFQGAVVIGRGGRVEYAAGFGFADIERRVPFTPDTPTDGASIAKTFTAAGLLMLAREGRVDLDAPVRDVLPEYPHADTRLRHLLAHSAGLPDYDWFDARVNAGEVRSNASHLALVTREALAPAFTPGSAFRYDNVAYDVAAMVIERRTGMAYADFVAQRFSRSLGLNAYLRPARFADWSGVRTRGYRRAPDGWKDHDAFDLEGFYGGDNIYLSANDLQRWAAGYKGLVGAATLREAVAPARLDDGRRTGLSLGSWYVSADGQRRYYTGSHNGFHNFGYADGARGLSVAWVANDAPPAWLQTALSRALVAVAEGREPEPLMPPAMPPVATDPAGTYRVAGFGEVTVRREGKQLLLRLQAVTYQAFPVGGGIHYVPGLDAYVRFAATPQGQVSLAWDSVYAVVPSTLREP